MKRDRFFLLLYRFIDAFLLAAIYTLTVMYNLIEVSVQYVDAYEGVLHRNTEIQVQNGCINDMRQMLLAYSVKLQMAQEWP